MRLLFLTILTVSAVVHYGACSQNGKLSSQGMLGKALLRRALEAMSNSPHINVKRRSLEEDDSGDGIKQTDAVEDIFVGSGSRSEERGESSGSRRNEVSNDEEKDQSGAEETSENDNTESSGDNGAQTDQQSQETESSGQSETQSEQKAGDQQEDSEVSSGSDTVETASDNQSVSPGSGSPEAAPSDNSESGDAPTQESDSNNDKSSTIEGTVQVAKSDDKTEQESKNNTSNKSENLAKKSTIEKIPSTPTEVKEDVETSTSSGESDEVTSGAGLTQGESSGAEDDGSAEAIRKGMESLTKLLKPVANGVDFQLFSGAAKPEDEEEDEEEEEKTVTKPEGKGESDKGEETQEQKPRVVKVKKCETKCAIPMTYDQCAVPRCEYKMGTIKDLCVWLCKHQKPVCKQECKEVE